VTGSPGAVRDRSYPLSRQIYILVDRAPGASLPPALEAFLRVALSPKGQAAIGEDAERFMPLTASQDRQALRLLDRR
jgi:phosphate transport system substrate-binding protein